MLSVRALCGSFCLGSFLVGQSASQTPEAPRVQAATAPVTPPAVHLEAVAYDPARERLVLFGGGKPTAGGPFTFPGETWEWDGTRWEVAVDSAAGPGPRTAAAMAYDATGRRVILFGGIRESSTGAPAQMLCDFWGYDGGWTRIDEGPCVTGRPAGASLVLDGEASLLLIDGIPNPPADTSGVPMRIWRRTADRWVLADSAGPRRYGLGAVAFDEARRVLVVPVFEGPDAGVWEWDGRRWSSHAPAGPLPRSRFPLVYDRSSRTTILFGGLTLSSRTPLDDTWAWDGDAWVEVSARQAGSEVPPARSNTTLVADPADNRLLLYGGARSGQLLSDLWIYEGGRWTGWR